MTARSLPCRPQLSPDAQDVHDDDVRRVRVDSDIPDVWRASGGQGGGDLVMVSRPAARMAAVSVADAVAGMAVPGRHRNDHPAGAGIRKRARPSRPISAQVISGPYPTLRRAQSTAAVGAENLLHVMRPGDIR